mmetsp:Transcript_28052/g.41240  ORF Transcript_28052/g.41240 Transcript_28052/m.41240 type:complete len:136 (-) Transcript_28052:27-434(-)
MTLHIWVVMDMRVRDVSHIPRDEYVLLQHVHVCCAPAAAGAVSAAVAGVMIYYRVLQGVAGCCSMVQWVAVCRSFSSVLQHVAGRCNVLHCGAATWAVVKEAIQCVAVCCSVLQRVAVPYSSTWTTFMEMSRYQL